MPTATADVKILNRLGLHARPAMALVDAAGRFSSDITICKGSQKVDAKSIMQIMMLAATQGTELKIEAEGNDADEAIAALKALVDGKFDEE
jgi:phosphocarrier protein